MRTLPAVALVLLACGGNGSPPVQRGVPDSTHGRPAADTTFPLARPGMLVAHPAEGGNLGGEWAARAASCADPRTLQLLARGDTVDLLIVLWLPRDSAPAGPYKILGPLDSTVSPRTARMGLQRMLYADLSYRAWRGTVWLESLDQRASGRLDVVLDESVSHQEVRYLGTFRGVPVDSAPGPVCQPARLDSTGTGRVQRPMLD